MNNRGVAEAESEWVLLLNNDTRVIDGDWLSAMVEHIQRKEVGAVGAKLLYPDRTIQHGGVIVGLFGLAGHAFRGLQPDTLAGGGLLNVIRNCSAVTGACLLTKKALYQSCGGLNEQHLPVSFNDVEYCLKLRRAGYSIVYTPYAELIHHESASRPRIDSDKEKQYMWEKWREEIAHDPYYSPRLTIEHTDYSLRFD